MAYSIDYINTICTDLGGSGGHEYEIDGLNEICTLLSATAGHTYSIDALNAICTAMGYTAGWRYEIEALNAICTGGGGTGGHKYEIHAWQEIQTGSLLNVFTDEYKAIYDAVSVKPSKDIALAQNDFVKSLVDSGVWAKFACIISYGWGMPSASDALFWANNISRKATLTTTEPTYDPLLGFTGNGSSSYIDTTFNPSTDGGALYTQNDCSAGFLFTNSRVTNGNGGSGISVGSNGICIYPQYDGITCYMRIQSNYSAILKNLGTNRLFTLVRKSSTLINLYQDRTILGSDISKASGVLQNLTMHNLHVNGDASSFQNDTIGLYFAGSQLTQADINAICDAWDALQFSINKTILMDDACDGSVIDANKWTITNSEELNPQFTQYNELIMSSDGIVTSNIEYYKNMVSSKYAQHFGVWKFSALSILRVGLTGYAQIGIRDKLLSDGYMIGFSNDAPKNITYQIKNGASASAYSFANAFENCAEIKIVITATHKVSVYKWVNSLWVQIGISQNTQLGNMYLYMATRGVTPMKTSIRDVKITKFDYSTLNPV